MREALSVNLDLAAADRNVAAGLGDVGNARSNLLPQINIGNRAVLIDSDRPMPDLGIIRKKRPLPPATSGN